MKKTISNEAKSASAVVSAESPSSDQGFLLPRTVTVALLLVCLDFFGWTTSGPEYRYFPVFASLLLAIMLDFADSQPVKSFRADTVAFLAIAYSGWLLSLAALALMEGAWARNTLVVVAVPILIGAAGWLSLLRFGRGRRVSVSRTLARAPYAAGGLFASLSLVEVLILNPSGPFELLSHEKTFVAIYVLCMPPRRGVRVLKIAMIAALMTSLVAYPSATTVATVLAAAAISWLVRKDRLSAATMSLLCTALIIGFLFIQNADSALRNFYSAVGRTDNTQTRLFLWQQVIPYIEEHPFAGGAAKVSITALANINGILRPTPLHNSFLTLLLVGGGVAILLLMLLVLTLTATAVSRSTRPSSARTNQWLPPLVAGFGAFAVNPVIDNLASSLFFTVLILMGFASAVRRSNFHSIDSVNFESAQKQRSNRYGFRGKMSP